MVVGDFAWDVVIRPQRDLLPGGDSLGEVLLAPGGSAANVAVWARRCGLETVFVGKVGEDRFGMMAEANLQAEGVQAQLIRTRARPTAAVAVLIGPGGERSMVSGQGADFTLRPGDLPEGLLARAGHLHLSAWSLFTDPPRAAAVAAARRAKAAGATLSLDPASFQMITQVGQGAFLEITQALAPDLFFPNLPEGQMLTGEEAPQAVAARLSQLYGGALIALKLDAGGALVLTGDETFRIPPGPDKLVDATGAGDSFAGAFLAGVLRGEPPRQAAELAVRVSSWVVGRSGARPEADDELMALVQGPRPLPDLLE